jgi:hypothetical protein
MRHTPDKPLVSKHDVPHSLISVAMTKKDVNISEKVKLQARVKAYRSHSTGRPSPTQTHSRRNKMRPG